jgi:hypothetical protein
VVRRRWKEKERDGDGSQKETRGASIKGKETIGITSTHHFLKVQKSRVMRGGGGVEGEGMQIDGGERTSANARVRNVRKN